MLGSQMSTDLLLLYYLSAGVIVVSVVGVLIPGVRSVFS